MALEEALVRARDPNHRYLAHLFLGRIHEDGRSGSIRRSAEYRRAVEIDPAAQSAAVALSHALPAHGRDGGARVRRWREVCPTGRRRGMCFWEYVVTNAQEVDDLLAALHREALE